MIKQGVYNWCQPASTGMQPTAGKVALGLGVYAMGTIVAFGLYKNVAGPSATTPCSSGHRQDNPPGLSQRSASSASGLEVKRASALGPVRERDRREAYDAGALVNSPTHSLTHGAHSLTHEAHSLTHGAHSLTHGAHSRSSLTYKTHT